MDSLHNEKYYNGEKDYRISVIEESNGRIVTTIYEIQEDREVAVHRVEHKKNEKEVSELVEEAKHRISMFPNLPK